ncbi:MAG: hypothetical protein R3B67_14725 [Phycisphaerales bacterium]
MLFKKNPAAMPQLIAFAFFDSPIHPNVDEICKNGSKLLKAASHSERHSIEVLEQSHDQIGFLVGENSGCMIQRVQERFPIEKIDPQDQNRQRVVDAQEHWALILLTEAHPMKRLIDLIKLSVMLQAMSMSHRVRAIIPSPLGVVFRASEWAKPMRLLIENQQVPLSHWVGYEHRENGKTVDAASIYMDELFGLPNIEIQGSPRSSDETVDLVECAVIETIMNGPIHKSTNQWITKTGVRYKVKYTKSCYDPSRKATQLVEI